jgi:transcriptional regulator with XRE-family HTH domain
MNNPFIIETQKVLDALDRLPNNSDVARRAGMHPSTLTKLRNNKANPTIRTMASLFDVLVGDGVIDADTTMIRPTSVSLLVTDGSGVPDSSLAL